MVNTRAKAIATAMLRELKSGGLIGAFTAASGRMLELSEDFEALEAGVHRLEESPEDPALQAHADVLEGLVIRKAEDYQTLEDKGARQAGFLKALDFCDQLTPGIRLFNVCRARTGAWNEKENRPGCCGLAYPGKLWQQPDKTRWKFRCRLDWANLFRSWRNSRRTSRSGTGSKA